MDKLRYFWFICLLAACAFLVDAGEYGIAVFVGGLAAFLAVNFRGR